MKPEIEQAVRDATAGEFDLLGELDAGPGWAAVLARAKAGASLVVLLVEEDDDGQLDIEVLSALDDGVAVGRTVCPACGVQGAGWPRACAACGRELPGADALGAAGLSATELLDEVRAAGEGEFDVLGALAHPVGGGALFFARELAGDRLVGLALHADHLEAELTLVVSWEPGAPEADPVPAAGSVGEDDPAVGWTAPREEPPPPVFPPRRLRRGRRARGLVAYAAAGALGAAGVGVLVFMLLNGRARAPDPGGPPPVGNGFDRSKPSPDAPPAPIPPHPAPVTLSADSRGTLSPPHPSPPPSSRPANPQALVVDPAASPNPVAALDDAGQVEQALRRYAAAVESRQTSRIQRAYPGITPAEIDRWERLFASVGRNSALQARYEVEEAPDVKGDAATVVFTLTLEYGGAPHPLTLRARLERGADGWWLQEVRTL
ncbi:MAG TPA: hypothetical protein VFE05_01690 [Longimicrobiaceae bacterium]|nr:hypothetical protein [Longimicrobiaceae bacterium]